MAQAPKVWVFFYGSYMNFEVLVEVGLIPQEWEVARLAGFDIVIAPRANLVRSDAGTVYGIVATATHAELTQLYAHAQDVLGEQYLPEAVLAETLDGKWRPALCYISPDMAPRPPDPDYVERIVTPAASYGFPQWYLDRLRGFTA
ncbi:MAG TPA: gamma-glutamylcyclotransferase family protein [Streptosporangiaceae bacterium]|nr:gamma-glutamylcyclotransferase family protein [Streptosporangiaceae bacterium]